MKKVGFALAALVGLALLSAPAFATTLSDFRGQGEAIEKLLERIHKHKKVKVVVRRPGDDAAGGGTSNTTTKPSTGGQGSVEPR